MFPSQYNVVQDSTTCFIEISLGQKRFVRRHHFKSLTWARLTTTSNDGFTLDPRAIMMDLPSLSSTNVAERMGMVTLSDCSETTLMLDSGCRVIVLATFRRDFVPEGRPGDEAFCHMLTRPSSETANTDCSHSEKSICAALFSSVRAVKLFVLSFVDWASHTFMYRSSSAMDISTSSSREKANSFTMLACPVNFCRTVRHVSLGA